eukprot:433588_1
MAIFLESALFWDSVTCVLCVIIYIPITIINTWKYYMNSNDIIFQKRYAYITIYEASTLIGDLLFVCIFNVATYTGNQIAIVCANFVYHTFVICLFYFWFWRFYSLTYYMKWVQALLNDKWKNIINRHHEDQMTRSDRWFVKNKSTLGNARWFGCYIIFPLILTSIIISIAPYTFSPLIYDNFTFFTIFRWWNSFITFIPFILLLILYLKREIFNDNFYISSELHKILFTYLVTYIFVIIWILVSTLVSNKSIVIIVVGISQNIVLFSQFFGILISTYWVNKKVQNLILKNSSLFVRRTGIYFSVNWNNQDGKGQLLEQKSPLLQIQQKKQETDMQHRRQLKLSLLNVLSDQHKFESFMKYISLDLSTNLLLAFVELIQFQQYTSNYIEKHKNSIDNVNYDNLQTYLFELIEFPKTVPKSMIVYDDKLQDGDLNADEFLDRLRRISHQLFLKYIEFGSNFEINISTQTQIEVCNLMQHKDDWLHDEDVTPGNLYDMLHFFDKCCNELFVMMMSSFKRLNEKDQSQNATMLAICNVKQ